MYQRILVKLSGEALSGDGKNGIIDSEALLSTAKVIKDIADMGVEVTIVIGAGNICRGALVEKTGMDRVTGDQMGMLGTVINSFAMKDALIKQGLKAVVLSAVEIERFTPTYTPELADKLLKEKNVVIFGGGTGKPFYSTDTCASLRAIETNCEAILIAKHGVDGIYDDDPRINKNAKMFESIKCSEIIARNLKVIDLSAVELLKDKNVDVCVFNMQNLDNFKKAVRKEKVGTTIVKG